MLPQACISKQGSVQRWFFILIKNNLIFTKEELHLALFWKWEFLELGNGLFITAQVRSEAVGGGGGGG